MSESLKIRLAARCEAAGRPENEDNFQVAEDLSVSNTGFTTDKVFPLGAKGTLLLVCDGMGGMNAGEVASAIGVETIKNLFAPQLLTNDIFSNDESICSYMKRAIVKADSRIKEEASKDEAKHGMGSTAVMAWLLGQKVYVAWCGDSRCYRFNPTKGLEQLSHDHSYVQDLVDTGQLSADLAFDHPNKNVITRSLGDPRGAAKPDAKVYDLRIGDVIMLCSDGLSDSLRDNEIAHSISHALVSMAACRDALWNDSKQAGWHDNVTVVLAQVVDDMAAHAKPQLQVQSPQSPQSQPVQLVNPIVQTPPQSHSEESVKHNLEKPKLNAKLVGILAVIVLFIIGGCILLWGQPFGNNSEKQRYEELKSELISVDFVGVPEKDIESQVVNAKKSYLEFARLEEKLRVKTPERDIIKNNINNSIVKTVMKLRMDAANIQENRPQEASEKEALANKIEKQKI